MHGRLENLLWSLALLVVIGISVLVFWRVAFDPQAVIALSDARAPWIAAPGPVTAEIHQWRRERVPVTRFFTFFEAPVRAGPVQLRMRALGKASLFINGQRVYETPSDDAMPRPPDDWKGIREVNVAPFLRKGRNSIGVSVRNSRGPGLLSLSLTGRGVALATDPGWLTSVDQRKPPTRSAGIGRSAACERGGGRKYLDGPFAEYRQPVVSFLPLGVSASWPGAVLRTRMRAPAFPPCCGSR